MPLAPVTTVRTSPVAWLVTRRLAPVIVPPVASVTTPVSAPVDAVCARPAGVNAPRPSTRQTRTQPKLFCRLEENNQLARTHPERRISNLLIRSCPLPCRRSAPVVAPYCTGQHLSATSDARQQPLQCCSTLRAFVRRVKPISQVPRFVVPSATNVSLHVRYSAIVCIWCCERLTPPRLMR